MDTDESRRLINSDGGGLETSKRSNFWQRMSGKRKILLLGLLVLLATVVVLAAVLPNTVNKNTPDTHITTTTPTPPLQPTVCETLACNNTASKILNNMDISIDPCNDFYDYACGGFKKRNPVPEGRLITGSFETMQEAVSFKIKAILKKLKKDNQRYQGSKSVTFVKNMYDLCLDKFTLEKEGVTPLHTLVKGLGHWDNNTNTTPSLQDAYLAKLAKFIGRSSSKPSAMESVILSVSIAPHDFAPKKNVFHLDHPSFVIDRKVLLEVGKKLQDVEQTIKAYRTFINETANLMGLSKVEALLPKIISLEAALARISAPDDDDSRSNPAKHTKNMTLADLKAQGFSKLQDFLTKVLAAAGVTGKDPRDSDEFIIYDFDYVKQIFNTLGEFDPLVVEDYIGLRILMRYGSLSSDKFRENLLKFSKYSMGISTKVNHEDTCLGLVTRLFPNIIGRLYVDDQLSNDLDLADSQKMVTEIIATFKEYVSQQKWLDDNTRKLAVEKISRIAVRVGFPSWIKDNKELDRVHPFPNMEGENAVMHLYRSYETLAGQAFKTLHEEVDWEKDWPLNPLLIQSSYKQRENSLSLPAGFLQGIFSSSEIPLYVIHGSLGILAAHEMSFAVDAEHGSHYDQYGSLKEWWSREAEINFDVKARCFQYQYSNITDEQTLLHLDGRKTMASNIADNAGVNQAFASWRKMFASDQEKQPVVLPGLMTNYTADQVFFLSYANTWCLNARYDYVKNQILNSRDSPGRYRVNVPLMNSPDFARAFKCSSGSKMNPVDKCTLW